MAIGSMLVVHVYVLGVDHLVGGAAAGRPLLTRTALALPAGRSGAPRCRLAAPRRAGAGGARGLALVEALGQLVRSLLEARGRLLHLGRVLGLQRLLGLGERLLELALLVRPELLLVLVVRLLGIVDQGVELVAGLDLLAALLVLVAVRLGFLDHALDLPIAEAGGGG